MTTIAISAAGGNSNTNGAWDGGVQPTSADDIVARSDGTSGNLTLAATLSCRSIDLTHYSGLLSYGAQFLVIGDASGGALNFPATMTISGGTGTTDFVSTSTNGGNGWPITTNGQVIPTPLFNGTGGQWTLQDTFNWNNALTFQRGSFSSNAQTMTGNTITRSGTNTLVLTLTNSTINLNSTTATVTPWTMTSTSLTFSATGSVINLTGVATTGARTFAGGGLTYGALNYTTSGGSGLTITGANTFTSLTVTGATRTVIFPASATTTVTTLVLQGGTPLSVVSSSAGTAATISATTATIEYASIKDITLTATAVNSINVSGNTNITFSYNWTIDEAAYASLRAHYPGNAGSLQDLIAKFAIDNSITGQDSWLAKWGGTGAANDRAKAYWQTHN